MDDGYVCMRWNHHNSIFCNVPANLRQKEMYTDVSLACDGKTFPAHKFVLASCSEYFQIMFRDTPCVHPVIFLKDVSRKELAYILDFMYTGEVDVPHGDIRGLLWTAKSLQVKGLAVFDEVSTQQSPGESTANDIHLNKRKRTLDCRKEQTQSIKSPKRQRLLSNNSKSEDSPKKNNSTTISIENEVLDEDLENESNVDEPYSDVREFNGDTTEQNVNGETGLPSDNFMKKTENWLKRLDDDDDDAVGLGATHIENRTLAEIKKKPYECLVCHQNFTRRDNLSNHIKTHTGEKPHHCNTCGKDFSRKDYLKQHERTHTGEKPYSCVQCDRSFTRREGLVDHMRCHSDFEGFKCETCGKTFKQKCGLRFHRRTKHFSNQDNSPVEP